MSLFDEHIQAALENYNDVQWLGNHSPLATPYMLSDHLTLTDYPQTARGRGRVVQILLLQALVLLGDISMHDLQFMEYQELQDHVQNGNREQKLVFWRYMHHTKLPVNVLIDHLNVARATFHRDIKERLPRIINDLANVVLRLLRPSLRAEPVPYVEQLYRRTAILNRVRDTLKDSSLSLLGEVGSGKTVLGAQLATEWSGAVAWITLRPGLNDHVGSVFFALGAALHSYGASHLWLQLLADGASINSTVALGLIRSDCSQLPVPGLLICIDQADHMYLSPGVLSLVHALRDIASIRIMLLQSAAKPLFAISIAVHPLDLTELHEWADSWNLKLNRQELQQIETFTRGHTQLVALVFVYMQRSNTITDALHMLKQAPSVDMLLERLIGELDPVEAHLVKLLAVLTSPTPIDVWQQKHMRRLIASKFVLQGSNDTIFLAGLIKQHVLQHLHDDEHRTANGHAATIYLGLGQFTKAAEHLIAAHIPDQAFFAWVPHREQEIRDGQAYTALRLFETIDPASWSNRDRDALIVIRAELRRLVGEQLIALEELNSITGPSELRSYIDHLRGEMLETQGQTYQSIDAYKRSLQTLAGHPSRQETSLYTRIGSIYLNHERDLDQAQQQAWSAQYTACLFSGEVAEEQGLLSEAINWYLQAQRLSHQLHDPIKQGRSAFNLAIIAAKHKDTPQALEYFQHAMSAYQKCGDLVRVARTRSNLAAFYIQVHQYAEALPYAQDSFAFFEQMHSPYWMGLNAVNLGEAFCALQDFEQAEYWINQCMQLEETSFMPYALTVLGQIRTHQARLHEAHQLYQQAVAMAQANQDVFAAAPAWRGLGAVLLQQGDQAAAHEAFQSAYDLFVQLELVQDAESMQQLLAAE